MTGAPLFDTMAQQIEAECGQHLTQARREADAILEEARGKGRGLRESVLASTRSEMENLKKRWEQKARSEAAKAELLVKKESVDRVLARIDEEIRSSVRTGGFDAVLDALLVELMGAVNGDVVLLAPESRVAHVQNWLSANGHGNVKVDGSPALWDGVAAQDAERTYRVSNALTTRFRRMEQEIRKSSMKALFGEGIEA